MRRGWRKMIWAIVLWSALFLVLLVVGVLDSGSGGTHCARHLPCEDESGANAAFVAIVLGWWFLGAVVLGAIWLATGPLRARRRRS